MDVKEEYIKNNTDRIQKNISEILDTPPPEVGEYDLVDKKYYSGSLQIMIENYLPEGMTLTEQEVKVVSKGMKALSTGVRSSIPINCYGPKCPFINQCPFNKIDKLPIGKLCPVEGMLMDLYTKRYLDEFEVHSDNMSEVTMMSMLAATHIIEMRAFITLGKETDTDEGNPLGIMKNVVGHNNDDEPIVQMMEHPAYLQLERAWRWRKNILESMVGTRKEKYRKDAALKEKSGISPSLTSADLKTKIEKLTIVDISED